MKELDSRYRVAEAARRVNERTYSHLDGRDLLAQLHPRHHIDITVRRDGQDTVLEADWITGLYEAIKRLRAELVGYDSDADQRRERDYHLKEDKVSLHVASQNNVNEQA